jgi:hypothetical protein
MTVVAVVEAVALVLVVIAFLHHLRSVEKRGAAERRQLADRIQRPDLLPAREAVVFAEAPPRKDDQMDMVGRIRISDKYGLDDGS